MHILLIAPGAPPKNAPEAMQVGRYLTYLDQSHRVTLVTTPEEGGWVKADPGLHLELSNTRILTVRLPWHRYVKRLLANKRLAALHVPDADYWLRWQVGSVMRRLTTRPDVIYSRSFPLSAALLARALKRRLGVPWVMHLSDPWADGPYRRMTGWRGAMDQRLETGSFSEADAITFTTSNFCDFYQAKYPALASKMSVTANVMPIQADERSASAGRLDPVDRLHIVHTGAFYGLRGPGPVLAAMNKLEEFAPQQAGKIKFWFVGNMSDAQKREIAGSPSIEAVITGPLGYSETRTMQRRADLLLSIEPGSDEVLLKGVLLAKMVDYLAMRKPILALTPPGSVSAELCGRGYGWSVDPSVPESVARLLSTLCDQKSKIEGLNIAPDLSPPIELTVEFNVQKLDRIFEALHTNNTHA